MSCRNDGGPAFPVPGLQHDETFNGMSIRDYFAAKVMAAILAGRNIDKNGFLHCDVAEDAYAYADAMLAAREAVKPVEKSAVVRQSEVVQTADADGWIEWKGVEYPVPVGTRVNVRFADGTESYQDTVQSLIWQHIGDGGDIIAYKLSDHAS